MSDKLSSPEIIRVTAGDGSAVLEWEKVRGADGYRVYIYSADKPDICIKTRYAQNTKKKILGLVNGREYLAAVRAFKKQDDRELIGELSGKSAFTPCAPALKAQNVICLKAGETAQLRWECRNEVPPVKFRSENADIAQVTPQGAVTAVRAGSTFIEITAEDGQRFVTRVAVERTLAHGDDSAVLLFTGDIMCAAGHQRAVAQFGYDFHDAFSDIKETLAEADLAIGVLETVCCDGAPYEHEQLRLDSGAPNFNAPSTFVETLADAGFDALVTANNHCLDAGRAGLEATVGAVRRYSMKNIGTLGDNPVFFDIKGIKAAIIACNMVSCGEEAGEAGFINPTGRYDRDYFLELVNGAFRMGAEYIIAYQHWGALNTAQVRKAQTEEARFMAEAGVSLILGSHPHVIQKFTCIKTSDGRKVPCAYSLGNFVTTMQVMKENRDSVILRAELKRGESGITTALSYIPCISETREHGASVLPIAHAFSEESEQSLLRTAAALGSAIKPYKKKPRVLISGSGNLNRVFSVADGFKLDKTLMHLSQLSLGRGRAFPAEAEEDIRTRIDVDGSFAEYVEQTKPDFVAVDFCTAAAVSCFKLTGTADEQFFFTNTKKFRQSAFKNEHAEQLTKIRPPFGESIWKPLVKRYAQGLLKSVPHERIILFRCRYREQRAFAGELRSVALSSRERFIKAMEDYFIQLADPSVVDLTDRYFAQGDTFFYEPAYYPDAYRAAQEITAGRGIRAVRTPDLQIWFDRVMRYYDSMTARSYQSWLLDMDNAADQLIAYTSAAFAAKHGERIMRLKRAGKSDLAHVAAFFEDDPAAAELIWAADIIKALLAGNLHKTYDFFSLAFRENFNVLKIMMRLLSTQTGVSVNEKNVELVFLLRGKTQLKRYMANASLMTADVWGSSVSRESINVSKHGHIGKYIVRQAPILAFEKPVPLEIPEGPEQFCGNYWRRRTLQDSFLRNGTDVIAESGSGWLIVDFYDMIGKAADYRGSLFQIDDFICRTDYYKAISAECTECYLFEKRDMKYCFEAVTRFAEHVKERYGGNIILIKTEPKKQYITLDDRLESFAEDSLFEIKKKFISLCEERFSAVSGCYVIDISKHFYSSDKFKLGGADIVHYEDEFYRQCGEYISEIMLGSERKLFNKADENYLLLRDLKLNRE